MGAMSTYLEAKINQFMLGGNPESFTTPGDSLYVALFTAGAGLETNAPTSEVSGGAYDRIQVPAADWTRTAGESENATDLAWAEATADWGGITHAAIMDASVPGTGNVLYHGALKTARTILTGDRFRLDAGDFVIQHD